MKILVDENIPNSSVAILRNSGHDVLDVRLTQDEGISDSKLWDIAMQQDRLLITTDRGFSQNRYDKHHGILIVSLRQPNSKKICDRIISAMDMFTPKQWKNMMVIMRDKAMSSWNP
ncbi:MAG: DUF5615 family PIN-like protein [Planctomycetes bacterium]|nr:DUF5615 family PIN-like protein [Planctomycetota bacterium]